ncbi:MutS domain V protein [Ancylostoma ceylanicum]|uniref:MutS domain V protein n=1 Tax=Ancylostoma ceylanicum TaxID=53326 RepID=A0A0D6LQ99_9BILA|nr:MutS domain V protein [Ancylostoma ceylanicum]
MAEEQSVVPSSQSAADAVIASISLSGSYLGVAIYDQSRTAIRLLNDVLEDQEFSTLDSCTFIIFHWSTVCVDFLSSVLQQEEPAMILVNKSQDIRFIRYISQHYFESGFKRISELFAEECSNEAENHLSTRFRIDISSRNMVICTFFFINFLFVLVRTLLSKVRALGALLKYMDSARIGVEYEAANVRTPITTIKTIRIGEMVEIDKDTYRALDIFSDDKGKQDCNLELTGKLHTLLGSLRSVRTISSSVMIGRYLESLSSPLALLKDDIDCYSETLVETYAVLNAMIDFEESYAENRLVMRPGVDPELDRAKGLYRQLPSILTRVAQEEASRFQAATCSVAYVPMIGYLVALPHDFQVENFEDVEVIYSTAHTLHAKDEAMRKLDEDLGDVKMRIIDKETTITLRMSSLILSRSSLLLAAERAGALLDVVISLSLTARHYGWTCPKFVDEPIIDATRVYHPLSQLITEHFVPNPVSSGVEYSKIKIFTGPNACGKSVYLKQVGLLVFLAHIGSFVPADFARIGTVNRILSRIYTVDSVLDGMSTFAKDLDQISFALRRGNERSLVIIDEFGKGTMTKNDEEEAEDEEEGPEERNSSLPPLERSASEDERYTSLQELDESRSSLPSALRTKGKKVDRSNLSVSFAIDMDEVRTEIATTTTTSDSEAMERVKQKVSSLFAMYTLFPG